MRQRNTAPVLTSNLPASTRKAPAPMINFFRSFFQSKIGLGLTIGFLVLIAIAFAAGDVGNSGSFGGLSGTNSVAVVGDEDVTTAELRQSADNAFRQVQQDEPTLSMAEFVEDGGLMQVLDTLLDRVAVSEFGKMLGVRAGENLINSEIRMISAFRGPDGSFSTEAYRAALQQQGLTDQIVRDDLSDGLIAQQVLVPAVFGAKFPDSIVAHYATQLREKREGSIALVPAELFAPKDDPTDKQLQAYYNANRTDFMRPERRQVRYALFGADQLADSVEPTAAEIKKRYDDNADLYRASEDRTFTQLIVPTRQAAESFRERVADGASLTQIAEEAGLETQQIGPIKREDYAQQANAAVAEAVFSADRGEIAPIARSPLGYHVVRIDDVKTIPARTLAQARDEIADALRADKQRRALTELASDIDARVTSGESFADIAEALDLDIQTTRPLLADGQVYGGQQGETAPEVVQPLIQTVFQMREGQPQIAEVETGETFALYEASEISPAAVPPLKEIRDAVTARWTMAEGAKAAKAASDRILKRVKDGKSLAEAIRSEETRLPPPQALSLTREQMMQMQRPNPPISLMFAMSAGTAKRLEAPRNAGFFLVQLDEITAGKVAKDDPLMGEARRGYGQLLSREYGDQLRNAIRTEVGIERNADAIETVRRQLTGQSAN